MIYAWPTINSLSRILATERFRLVKQQSGRLLNRRVDRVAIFESY
jgi:hypothetical protein